MDTGNERGESVMTVINFGRYSYQDKVGYVITAKSNEMTSATMVALDQDGKVHAAHSVFDGGIEDATWTPLETRENGHWAYSMMTGHPSDALLDALDIPHVDRASLAERLFAEAGAQASQHLSGLNAAALKVMAKAPEKRLSTYEFYAVDGERGLFRQQAAQSFPVFADLFNVNLQTKMAIDRKKPLNDILIPLVSEMTGQEIGKALLKRFSQAPALPEGVRLSTVMNLASRVQLDWFPKSEEDWMSFYTIAVAIEEDLGLPMESLTPLLNGSGGNWADLVRRSVLAAYPEDDHPSRSDPNAYLRTAAFNARDTLECFTDIVVLPLVAHAQEAENVYLNHAIRTAASDWGWKMLFHGRTLPDLLDISRRFHQERAGMMEISAASRLAQAKSQIKEGGWPGLTAPVQAPNGYWLVPLCTPEELTEEGKRMRHCVGGYSGSAKSCSSHIVSVRTVHPDGTTVSHSTCEFSGITSQVPTLQERQHQAHGNSRPEAKYLDAIAWYKKQVQQGKLKTNWELIRAFLDNTLVVTDQVERLCGYDWRDYDSLNKAVRPWGAFVTKAYRTQGLNALMDSAEAGAIIEKLTPAFLSATSHSPSA